MKAVIALAAAAALLASAPPAAAETSNGVGIQIFVGGWIASSVAGAVTLAGTGTAAAENGDSQRGWGIASAVTGVANLGCSVFFLVAALQPPCQELYCFDVRGAFAVISGINGLIGISNVALAVFTLTRKSAAADAQALGFAVQPAAFASARGEAAPGLVVLGRF